MHTSGTLRAEFADFLPQKILYRWSNLLKYAFYYYSRSMIEKKWKYGKNPIEWQNLFPKILTKWSEFLMANTKLYPK